MNSGKNGSTTGPQRGLTGADVHEVLGQVSDDLATAILATGGSRADLDAALAWLAGETETLSEEGHPLVGAAAEIFELLATQEAEEEDTLGAPSGPDEAPA